MNIVVCIKEVPDPDASVALDSAGNVNLEGIPYVPNPDDEHAVEAAVQIKEDRGASITVLSVGLPEAERTVIRAVAMGADRGVLVDPGPSLERNGYATAAVLAAAVRRLDSVDLILCGREAADTSGGLVGAQLALLLGMPFITLVTEIEVGDSGVRVHRLSEAGEEVTVSSLPVLLTVSHQVNHPRIPSVLNILQAKRRGVERVAAGYLLEQGLLTQKTRPSYTLIRRYLPSPPGNCELIQGADERERAVALVEKLKQEGLV